MQTVIRRHKNTFDLNEMVAGCIEHPRFFNPGECIIRAGRLWRIFLELNGQNYFTRSSI
jgi:hypothetical protein